MWKRAGMATAPGYEEFLRLINPNDENCYFRLRRFVVRSSSICHEIDLPSWRSSGSGEVSIAPKGVSRVIYV